MAKKLRIAAIVLLCAFLLWSVFTIFMLLACDKITIYEYRGLENMFRLSKTDYVASIGSFHAKVPGFAVRLVYPENDNHNYSKYQDKETARYFVELEYNKTNPKHNTVEHNHDSKYTIEYLKDGPVEHENDIADEKLQALMLDIAGQLYDLDHIYEPGKDQWASFSGGHGHGEPDADSQITVTFFTLYCHKNGYIVEQDGKAVYSYIDGKLTKMLNIPDSASFEYCIWKR